MEKCYRIFILSDARKQSVELMEFLSEYDTYELHFIPTDMNLFDVLNFEPDVIVMDSKARKVVKCHEWQEVA